MTRFPVTALRSVDLGTPDLDRSERFYTEVWGLEVVARHEGAIYLRASGSDHHVVALHASAGPALSAVTFRVASHDDFAPLAAAISAAGGEVLAPPAANAGPDGGTVMIARGPEGGVLRFVHGDRCGSPMSISTARMSTPPPPSTRRRWASR
jgi:catechol 2,3-dioxygenase-like lactoylglutathione lyase family enzyme